MSSLLKANWDRRADRRPGGQAQVSIGMHAHPKMLGLGAFYIFLSQNTLEGWFHNITSIVPEIIFQLIFPQYFGMLIKVTPCIIQIH